RRECSSCGPSPATAGDGSSNLMSGKGGGTPSPRSLTVAALLGRLTPFYDRAVRVACAGGPVPPATRRREDADPRAAWLWSAPPDDSGWRPAPAASSPSKPRVFAPPRRSAV